MTLNSPSPWPLRLSTLMLWALAAASVVFWGLRLSTPASGMATAAAPAAPLPPDAQAIARLLGALPSAQPAAVAVASRYTLAGVLDGRDGRTGAALIAVDGQPARTYRIGAVVDGNLELQSLGRRSAALGVAGAASTVTLDLPDDAGANAQSANAAQHTFAMPAFVPSNPGFTNPAFTAAPAIPGAPAGIAPRAQ